jgi:5-methylcytosine-specific restriction endonuclease McrA
MSPWAPPRPCRDPLCPGFALPGRSRCALHALVRARAIGSAARRGYGYQHRLWRLRILARDPFCACGCGRPSVVADHIRPLSQGGDWSLEIGQGLALECHARKTALQSLGWGKRGGRGIKSLGTLGTGLRGRRLSSRPFRANTFSRRPHAPPTSRD